MNDLIESARIGHGSIKIHGIDINSPEIDVIALRRQVGMVFQKSNPFPKSIYENITYGLRNPGRAATASGSMKSSRKACAAPRFGTK